MRRIILLLDCLALLVVLTVSACITLPPKPTPTDVPPSPVPRIQATPPAGDRHWIIPGNLGTIHVLTGTIAPEDREEWLFVQVSRIGPGSPSRSSRRVVLSMQCQSDPVVWSYRPLLYDPPRDVSERTACGESKTVYFTFDANYRRIRVVPAGDPAGPITYTITAAMHAPY